MRKQALQQDRGLSLIELVIAMALFALVAVMGAQGLTGMLRLRDDLTERDTATAELTRSLSLIRADLSAALPMLFFSPDGGPVRSAIGSEDDGFSLSIGGQPGLATTAPGGLSDRPALHRVIWRLEPESGHLIRQRWSTLIPADQSAQGPVVVVMEGLQALRVRSYWGELGWADGVRIPGQTSSATPSRDGDTSALSEAYSSQLPLGIEITLVHSKLGEITLLEALQ